MCIYHLQYLSSFLLSGSFILWRQCSSLCDDISLNFFFSLPWYVLYRVPCFVYLLLFSICSFFLLFIVKELLSSHSFIIYRQNYRAYWKLYVNESCQNHHMVIRWLPGFVMYRILTFFVAFQLYRKKNLGKRGRGERRVSFFGVLGLNTDPLEAELQTGWRG